jgi:hypothetical protein
MPLQCKTPALDNSILKPYGVAAGWISLRSVTRPIEIYGGFDYNGRYPEIIRELGFYTSGYYPREL